MNVTITALHSVNVHNPEFVQKHFVVFLPENTTVGTIVIRVNATDRDAGAAGQVKYILVTGAPYFALDSVTGIVTTK